MGLHLVVSDVGDRLKAFCFNERKKKKEKERKIKKKEKVKKKNLSHFWTGLGPF